jgi:hypothetical protein
MYCDTISGKGKTGYAKVSDHPRGGYPSFANVQDQPYAGYNLDNMELIPSARKLFLLIAHELHLPHPKT